MYGVLTANTPGCVAFSLPVQRRTLENEDPAFFPIPPQPAPRAADKEGRFRARAASGPRSPSCSRDGSRFGLTDYRAAGLRYAMSGGRLGAVPGLQRQTRRLLPPTCSDGPTLDAPDCVADQDPRNDRADAKRKLRTSPRSGGSPFGAAPRSAFWPSPHPRIRWTVASPGRAICARHAPRPPPSRVPKCPTRC